ncbi:MAG: thermopsin family protease [Thermoplasmata archaeon]|nr:thermopsin family protease [Thermoplasmata archaeon]
MNTVWTGLVVLLLVSPLPGLLSSTLAPQPPVAKFSDGKHPHTAAPRTVTQRPALTPAHAVNVSKNYRFEPAPMGITDYGVDTFGFPYQYVTTSFEGDASINSIQALNASGTNPSVSFQLNVNLALCQVFCFQGSQYDYWIQDVADYNTSNGHMDINNNIWNLSAPSANILPTTLSGQGQLVNFKGTTFYGFDSCNSGGGTNTGSCTKLTPPYSLTLNVATDLEAGVPTVAFYFNDGNGINLFDSVSFPWAAGFSESRFLVDGYGYNPANLFYDAEFILGGEQNGETTTVSAADMNFYLYFANAYNYQTAPYTYNFGSNTAETVNNIVENATNGGQYLGWGWHLGAGRGLLYKPISPSLWGQLIVEVDLSYGNMMAYFAGAASSGRPGQQGRLSVEAGLGHRIGFRGGWVALALPSGNYTFQVSQGSNGYGGFAVWVHGNTTTTLHLGYQELYRINVNESGLPSGTRWLASVSGFANNSVTSTVGFWLPNGNYPLRIGYVAGFHPQNELQSLNVSGSNVTVAVPWSETEGVVTFSESGLPNGSTWLVQIGNVTQVSFGPDLNFSLANGSYQVSPSTEARGFYSLTIALTVAGQNLQRTIQFLEFNGSLDGTVTPTSATILLNGATVPGPVGGIFLVDQLKPGTYLLVVAHPGYSTYRENISISPGSATYVHIELAPIASASVPWIEAVGLGILAAGLGVALLAVVLQFRRRVTEVPPSR